MRLSIIVLLLVMVLASSVAARIWYVHPSGSGDAPNIQAAIDSSSHGDIIELANGTFAGTGNRDIEYKGKRITVRSQSGDPSLCTINAQGTMVDRHWAFHISYGEDSLSVLRDITMTEGSYDEGGAIHIEESSPLIVGCVFVGNQAEEGAGIFTYNSNSIIRNCWFEDNYAMLWGAGLCLKEESPVVEGCTFVGNMTAGDGAGIYCDRNPAAMVTRCTFYDNEAWGIGSGIACLQASPVISYSIVSFGVGAEAIGCGTGSSPVLTCSNLYGNAGGDWVGCISGQYGTIGNIREDPRFCNPGAGDFTLHTSSPCKTGGTGCGLQGAWPVGCASRTFVLNDAGTGDFPTIQAAVDVAWDGDTIVLLDGTYTGSGNRDIAVHNKAITLRSQSGNASSCTVDAEASSGDLHRIMLTGGDSNVEINIEDITITGGFVSSYGGGALCLSGNVSFTGCVISYNTAYGLEGGGIRAEPSCSLYVSECLFTGNTCTGSDGGGLSAYGGTSILNSEFISNQADNGAAIWVYGGGNTISGCYFHDNTSSYGGAVMLTYYTGEVSDCQFDQNPATYGALYIQVGSPLVSQCTFTGNSGSECCGVFSIDSACEIRQCTFVQNSGGTGGVIRTTGSQQPDIYNSILAFNTGTEPVTCLVSLPLLGCCDIYGNELGDWVGCIASQDSIYGNFHEDPRFCDPDAGDLSLHFTSPCAPANSGGCGLIGARAVGCGPETYVLNAAGTGDFPTIQAAIDVAWDFDIIELLDGTYTGYGNRDLDTKGKAITLRSQSGDASSCIIDAEADSSDQHRGMTLHGSGALETRVEGVTITGGWINGFGGGVYCYDTTPTFHRCVFSDNTSRYSAGGGLYTDSDSPTTVTECLFTGNLAASDEGGGMAVTSDLTMSDCEFSGNNAEIGAALWTYGSHVGGRTVDITDCYFHDHSIASGSVVKLHHSYGEMSHCTFSDNTAPEGALYLMFRNPLISECTFARNSGSDCGALCTWSCWSEISQCTFADNSSSGGPVWLSGGSPQPEMNSCILAFNTNSVAVACTESFPQLACCDIYGNDLGDWVGCIAGQFGNSGNIRMDPLFCGELNPDEPYSLQLASPCMADSAPPGCPRLGAHDVGCTGGSGVEEPWAAEYLFMSRPLPNPAGAMTQVAFALPPGARHEKARLDVYDITGRHVRNLLDRNVAPGELQKVTWNGCDETGAPVSSGVYFLRLQSGGEGRTAKVVIAR